MKRFVSSGRPRNGRARSNFGLQSNALIMSKEQKLAIAAAKRAEAKSEKRETPGAFVRRVRSEHKSAELLAGAGLEAALCPVEVVEAEEPVAEVLAERRESWAAICQRKAAKIRLREQKQAAERAMEALLQGL